MQKKTSRLLHQVSAVLITFVLSLGLMPATTLAEPGDEPGRAYVYFVVERSTIGQGVFVEPVRVPITADETTAYDLITHVIGKDQLIVGYNNNYLQGIKGADERIVVVPEYIALLDGDAENGPATSDALTYGQNPDYEPATLAELDYSTTAGWMTILNNASGSLGLSQQLLTDGDVIRIVFSIEGYGADVGLDFMGSTDPAFYDDYQFANFDELIVQMAQANAVLASEALDGGSGVDGLHRSYTEALALLNDPVANQSAVDWQTMLLKVLLDDIAILDPPPGSAAGLPPASEVGATYETITDSETAVVDATAIDYGSEWLVLGLARNGQITSELKDTYLANLAQHITSVNGKLSSTSYTEYSRVVLALTSLGIDATDFAGYDLTEPLAHFDEVTSQGIYGAVYALLALDAGDYAVAQIADGANQASRQRYVDFTLDQEITGGGFTLFGSVPDPDTTAMALQALAPYRERVTGVATTESPLQTLESHSEDAPVAAAINRALAALSTLQQPDGGFISWGTLNAESSAQVIIALTTLGIPLDDTRFVKNDNTVYVALMSFYDEEGGGFRHDAEGSGVNGIATEQATRALVALRRALVGATSLYDMSDVTLAKYSPATVPEVGPGTDDPDTDTSGPVTTSTTNNTNGTTNNYSNRESASPNASENTTADATTAGQGQKTSGATTDTNPSLPATDTKDVSQTAAPAPVVQDAAAGFAFTPRIILGAIAIAIALVLTAFLITRLTASRRARKEKA
jgi:hypothetical protein